MRGLKDKVAIITGAAGGIGRSLVQRFLEEGARVAALDLNQAGLDELKGQFQQYAGQLATVQLDITDHDAVAKAVQRIHADLKQIDILVNNAGWDVAMQFVETTPDLWDKLIAINLKGPLSLQHAVVPLMVEAGGGKIVNIASDAGRVGSSGESVYAACKGGIIAFSKTLARETARNNVRVNVVCPGPTDTALLQSFTGGGEFGQKIYDGLKRAIPLKRLGQPEDIPGAVAFLSSDDANFITGQVMSVSGGLTMHG
ncbi:MULTISPECIES: glucose 1-dehydrogenase [Cupriavidus]|uniref:Glucose 1-dehydrogenase n=1 Tax=Cupriavidus basilensis TaxID=68895 RepID=A0A643G0W2_9BURK|nr:MULTISPECIES: glucose 1-dehydrogenase [Cupriavidus]KUE87966.1 2-hydroxycyclohexanecarboxyl-CoA dehydrogenase [Cupriavidus necator]NOV23734.1 glucose 1-dehydrogenase [Cupriavidus necator]QOT81788.1 glucose 1-dehydrogenase [Cupriavidus basilensis]BDB30359.1 glucose 1-dehydrogenase [Cupriavidus sp. P-10]